MLRPKHAHHVPPPDHERTHKVPKIEAERLDAEKIEADAIDRVQLVRLAGAILKKSPEDLMAVAESNPMLIWEWLEAFRIRKQKAEAEARYWAASMAALSTAVPEVMRKAAE